MEEEKQFNGYLCSAPYEISKADMEQEIYDQGYDERVFIDGVVYGKRSFYS